ncbi:CHAP domain-containing protein [Marininema halotolerans]|uniref:CHAP domain-containing protein n=1 Tax=Marininema halotolerans TaxID=1155944 RepID=A0A1I6S471_9BACL|nr:CHAP domain-containing protein [Marininema halotolerans]SFS71732.1 CHAP domain-containing protein [Marininema halotolerans]
MKRSFLVGFLAACLLVGTMPAEHTFANSKVDSKKSKLKDVKKEKEKAKEAIEELKKEIQPSKEKVEEIEKKISETNKKIHEAEKEKKKNEEKLKYYEHLFKDRFKLMYQQGEMASMQSLLESKNLATFLERFETLRLILMRDHALFDKYDQIRRKQEALKEKHEELAKEQKNEAEKARKIYEKVQKEMEKTREKLSKLDDQADSIQSELDRLTMVSASLYPYKFAGTAGVDPWGFYNRQCTSFVAWRMNQHGLKFTNSMRGGHFGNAGHWDENARAIGMKVDQVPRVGAIAQFNPGVSRAGSVGHVAYVTDVNGSSVVIEEYNMETSHGYGKRVLPASGVSNYIHVQ